jgi:hypothetical protein
LIPEHLKHAAVNQYINNAFRMNGNSTIVSVKGSLDLSHGSDEEEDHLDQEDSHEERKLLQEMYKHTSQNIAKSHSEVYPEYRDNTKNEGLLNMLENGNLFNINMDDVYRSVGKTQVKNFSRLYGNKFIK